MKTRRTSLMRLTALAVSIASAHALWADTLKWSGGGTQNDDGSYNWNDPSNWVVVDSENNETAATDFPGYDAWSDAVVFDTSVTVKLNTFKFKNGKETQSPHIGTLTVNDSTTLTLLKGNTGDLFVKGNEGTGTLKLCDGINVHNREKDTIVSIVNALQLDDDAAVQFTCENSDSSRFYFEGSISGNSGATLTLSSSTLYGGFHIIGDCANFYGTMNWKITGNTSATRIYSTANLANAVVKINSDDHTCKGSSYLFAHSGGNNAIDAVYKFAALDANIGSITRNSAGGDTGSGQAYSTKFQIGDKDNDSRLSGKIMEESNAYNGSIDWVGAKTLTLATRNLKTLNIMKGGAVVYSTWPSSNKPSINFKDAGGYIGMGSDQETNADILSSVSSVDADALFGITNDVAVALDLSDKATLLSNKKFGKKGTGALVITGLTNFGAVSVDGGTLTVPAGATLASLSADDNKLIVDVSSLTVGDTAITVTDGFNGEIDFTGKDANLYSLTASDDNTTFKLSEVSSSSGIEIDGITISSDFISQYNLVGKTTEELQAARTDGNGYSYFACYALGLEPTKESSTPKVAIAQGSDGTFTVSLGEGVTVADGVAIDLKLLSTTDLGTDFTVKSEIGKGSGASEAFTVTASEVSNCEFFKLQIDIEAASAASGE